MATHVLGIDTAGASCGVTLLHDDEPVYVAHLARPRSHASELAAMVEDALARCRLSPGQLDVVAVSAGPGSYTGLRIGVSTAKGLAFATDAALVGVPTLTARARALAANVPAGSRLAIVAPSRRGEVYLAVFEVSVGQVVEILPVTSAALDALPELIPSVEKGAGADLLIAGAASGSAGDVLMRAGRAVRRIADPEAPARWIARLGLEQFQAGRIEDRVTFEPAYLKPFTARRGGSLFDRLPPMTPPPSVSTEDGVSHSRSGSDA